MKGYLQVYTGTGKGKTTAALGLCLRALGNDMRVLFAQFIKGTPSSEFTGLESFPNNFTYRNYGKGRFICKATPTQEDIDCARQGLQECTKAMASGEFDIVVLDEANCAVKASLFPLADLLTAVKQRHPDTEIIVTGRDAAPQLLEIADLVTEMREVKHYFKDGVPARKGIEH